MTIEIILAAGTLAYLAGSVNFAILFFKIAGKADPRLSFSGNAGTTNVYRQAGMGWAVVVFLLDISRALAVALLACYFVPGPWLAWVGFFLILGNTYPCFHNFQGGKGVANYLGYTLIIVPWAAMFSATIWLAVYWLKRLPFLASFFMVAMLAVGHGVSQYWAGPAATGAAAALGLILFNHRKNIIDYRASKQEEGGTKSLEGR